MSPGREPLQDVPRHDPPERPGPAHPDRAEQLPVGDQDDAVRPAGEPAVEAPVDERQAARRRGSATPAGGRGHDVRVGQQLREAGRLVGREHHPGTFARASGRRSRRWTRWAPAAATARASRTGCRPAVRPRPRSPRSAAGCARRQAPLPVALLGIGTRPAPGSSPAVSRSARRSSACAHRNVAAASMSPGSSRSHRASPDVVERRGRRQQATPGLGGVAQGPGLERGEVRGQPLGQLAGEPAQSGPELLAGRPG